ncbi:hypothetical protein M4914_10955 [Streptomyces somaliensis DSM 40738]|uniref:AG1 protein n=1 Tax=Streptomyces somaliensis (strain ATCC 33201 / DSM 40738 / JCM 12659 / KCTC 9044 / NCTC 11332 / NRRL B-12077 / IP 733) TaxID=1134445 RepID=A0AA44DAM8_STRE0|nr:hypothetical protein [Streptomyces somaliensis DSM 40738]NKY13276.1 hypothetical protein [Streptomyces somaliensis DSM 40738]
MAWDEWEQLKAEAAGRAAGRMRLNGLPPEDAPNSGGPNGVLRVTQTDLAAIGDEAFKLYTRLWKEARVASTDDAGTSLSTQGFTLGGALKHVSTRWEKQLNSLMDACALISNHMDFTKNAHQGDEYHIKRRVSSIHTLDAGFDEQYVPPGKSNEVYGPAKKKD